MTTRPARILLYFILLLPLLIACASQPDPAIEAAILTPTAAPTPTPHGRGTGGTLHLLHWEAPEVLNPHLTGANKDAEISRITYEPLATFDKDNNMVLLLAAEEPTLDNGGVSPDGKSVTWKLRQDVLWSDGEPFTADDVAFTYEFIMDPAVNAVSWPLYEPIESIEVLDDYTVKVNFAEVNPAWFLPFTGIRGSILPAHAFADYEDNYLQAPANYVPVGTGPYRMLPPGIRPQEVLFLGTSLIQTVKILYEPNEFFREEDKPYFSRIELKGGGLPAEAARSVLQAGDVDFAFNLQLEPSILDELASGGNGHVVTSFGSRVEQIIVNHTDPNRATASGERSSLEFEHPFFSDLRVRQAFAYAIDREAIAALYGSTGQVTYNNLVAPANYVSPNTYYEYNPDKAIALLEEAGWRDEDGDGIREKDGRDLKIVSHAASGSLQRQSQRQILDDLAAVGVDVEVKLIDASVYTGAPETNPDSVFRFQADLQSIDVSTENPDPRAYMQFWLCDSIPQKDNGWSGINLGRWCNPDYDDLFFESNVEIDPDKRRDLFIAMNDLQVQDVAMIPLVHLAKVAGVSDGIEGVDLTPWDANLWNVKDWRRSDDADNR
ncbi:MAG: peptide ABC transporter substrate-binding protein [Anaerolineae bacterium]